MKDRFAADGERFHLPGRGKACPSENPPVPKDRSLIDITIANAPNENSLAIEERRSNAELEQFAYVASHDSGALRAVALMVLLQHRYQGGSMLTPMSISPTVDNVRMQT
jgi:hypothetical protein